jgi:hypothetical protein
MNNRDHFFGAYLDVVTLPTDYLLSDRRCSNGHTAKSPFCPTCGNPMKETVTPQQRNITDHYEILDDDLADTLLGITPIGLFGSGRMILRSNEPDSSVWLDIDRDGAGLEIKPFPTDTEQEAMKATLLAMPAAKALQRHPLVVSVSVLAGYVEDKEY